MASSYDSLTILHAYLHSTRNRPAISSVVFVSVLTRMNTSAAIASPPTATSLRPTDSPLGGAVGQALPQTAEPVPRAPHVGLTARLGDFSMNLHESSSQAVQKGRPARPQGSRNRRRTLCGTSRISMTRERRWRTLSTAC